MTANAAPQATDAAPQRASAASANTPSSNGARRRRGRRRRARGAAKAPHRTATTTGSTTASTTAAKPLAIDAPHRPNATSAASSSRNLSARLSWLTETWRSRVRHHFAHLDAVEHDALEHPGDGLIAHLARGFPRLEHEHREGRVALDGPVPGDEAGRARDAGHELLVERVAGGVGIGDGEIDDDCVHGNPLWQE